MIEKNLWHTTASQGLSISALSSDKSVDTVVIGGGYTGVSCALRLAEKGNDVVLLEANEIGYGGSGRNVGLVNPGLWMEPDKVERIVGEVEGKRLNQLLCKGPEVVFSNIAKYNIECELTQTGTLHCAHSVAGLANLKDRIGQYKNLGMDVELLSKYETADKLGTAAYYGSLHLKSAGTIQPLSYICGLASAAMQQGAAIYQYTPVVKIERCKNHWKISTPNNTLTCDAIVMATNAYHQNINAAVAPTYTPIHYFQLATCPLSDEQLNQVLPEKQGCWDTAAVMSSIRRDLTGRLIIGSVGSLKSSAKCIHNYWASRKLKQLFPFLGRMNFEYTWQGRIAYTQDHLPHIVKFGPNAINVYGYSGRGISPGAVFGRAVADYIYSGDIHNLPVKIEQPYVEKFTKLKGALFEFGSVMYHSGTTVF